MTKPVLFLVYIVSGMRSISTVFFMLFVSLGARVYAQEAKPTPQKPAEVSYEEILEKFRYRSYPNRPDIEINKEIIDAIGKRGLWFVLSDKDRKELLSAGGSADLISAIDGAVSEAEKKRIGEIIRDYQFIVDNYTFPDFDSLHNVERLTRVINACKNFLNKYSGEPRLKPQIDWMRQALPAMERQLQNLREVSRIFEHEYRPNCITETFRCFAISGLPTFRGEI